MIKLAVLPFGKSGVVSASMLGLGRALGETMAVLMILSPGLNYSIKLLQASQNQTDRSQHRRAAILKPRSPRVRADRHRPGAVPHYVRGEFHRP